MVILFIFISFVLNAVSLFAIVLLFTRQNRLYAVKDQQEKLVKDMEEMMAAYLLEMKEENERFMKEFSGAGQQGTATIKKPETAENLEIPLPIMSKPEDKPASITAPSMQRNRAAKVYNANNKKPAAVQADQLQEPVVPPAEKDQLHNIFSLQEQGLSIEDIAKKLNKGKTEVELALKFASAGKNG
ncbi:hypothetical protein QYG89_04885 [Bacillus sp. B190/17]|uniref:Swarming motility protein SwrB n=1 Tax=Bacillus lumedeiriae TaxID=3058829 RepID=A0ABW8I8N5_9BACI